MSLPARAIDALNQFRATINTGVATTRAAHDEAINAACDELRHGLGGMTPRAIDLSEKADQTSVCTWRATSGALNHLDQAIADTIEAWRDAGGLDLGASGLSVTLFGPGTGNELADDKGTGRANGHSEAQKRETSRAGQSPSESVVVPGKTDEQSVTGDMQDQESGFIRLKGLARAFSEEGAAQVGTAGGRNWASFLQVLLNDVGLDSMENLQSVLLSLATLDFGLSVGSSIAGERLSLKIAEQAEGMKKYLEGKPADSALSSTGLFGRPLAGTAAWLADEDNREAISKATAVALKSVVLALAVPGAPPLTFSKVAFDLGAALIGNALTKELASGRLAAINDAPAVFRFLGPPGTVVASWLSGIAVAGTKAFITSSPISASVFSGAVVSVLTLGVASTVAATRHLCSIPVRSALMLVTVPFARRLDVEP